MVLTGNRGLGSTMCEPTEPGKRRCRGAVPRSPPTPCADSGPCGRQAGHTGTGPGSGEEAPQHCRRGHQGRRAEGPPHTTLDGAMWPLSSVFAGRCPALGPLRGHRDASGAAHLPRAGASARPAARPPAALAEPERLCNGTGSVAAVCSMFHAFSHICSK